MTDVARLGAVVGFVDLSGFTATSELLGQEGREGTEQLRDFINSLFAPAIDELERAGGEVGWFAGDAMTVLFDLALATVDGAVHALAVVADQIHNRPPTETVAGQVSMSAKVGVAAGDIEIHRHDGTRIRRWIDGLPIDRSAGAEGLAEPGQVVVHRSVGDALTDAALRPVDDEHALLLGIEAPPNRVSGHSDALAWLRKPERLPAAIASATPADLAFVDEHRPTTSLFLALPGERHQAEQVARIDTILARNGGELLTLGSGDKGVTVFAAFGAPQTGPDRKFRSITAAAQLRDALPDARIGLASGLAYAGRVGSVDRWDYTTIGDRVNVAARLMQAAAPGEIVADLATAEPARNRLELGPERALSLKGKTDAEAVVTVAGVTARADDLVVAPDAAPLVGRAAELIELAAAVRADAGLAVLIGRAGAGKTRLAEALLARLQTPAVVSAVDQTERERSHRLWQRGLTDLLGIGDGELDDALGGDARWPLLAPLVGRRNVIDTPLTRDLTGDERHQATVQTLVDTIRRLVAEPIIWLVEDLHFADDASIRVFADLAPHLPTLPLIVVATARPDDAMTSVLDAPRASVIELAPLAAESIAELVVERWHLRFGVDPHDTIVAEFASRCGGSPLFAEQLVAWAASRGLDGDAAEVPDWLDIPTSITDLVLARVDALSEQQRRVATLASVLGRTFEVDDLLGAFSELTAPAALRTGLDGLRDEGVLVGSVKPSFSHGLLQEVTYDRLSFVVRRQLHLAVVEHLERARPQLDVVAEQLAHHAEHTDDTDRQRRYFRMAGDIAREGWAIPGALRWYELLAPLVAKEERAALFLELGRMTFTSGDWTASERHLVQAIKQGDDATVVHAELELAELLINQGSTDRGFDLLDHTVERVEATGDHELLRQGLELQAQLATLLGDVERAETVRSHYESIRRSRADGVWERPLDGLAPLLWMAGELDSAESVYRELLLDAIEANDLRRAAQLGADLAGILYERGDVEACVHELETARTRASAAGFHQQLAIVAGNESLIRFELGDLDTSADLAQYTLQIGLELGDLRSVSLGLERLGVAMREPGVLQRAFVLAHDSGDRSAAEDILAALHELSGSSPAEVDSESPSGQTSPTRGKGADHWSVVNREMRHRVDALPALTRWRDRFVELVRAIDPARFP